MTSPDGRKSLIIPDAPVKNDGFDNINEELIIHMNENIISPKGVIYCAKKRIGAGQFGQVYKVVATNKSDYAIEDFQLLDILPYNGDNRGTQFDGTYQISKIL